MTKVFKSKIFLGAICMLLAAIISFVMLPRYYASKSDTVQVVKLLEDIPAGTSFSEEMLSVEEVGAYGLPASVVRDLEGVVGKVAYEPMYAGEYVTETRLITEEEYQKIVDEETKGLDPGYCLVTVEVPTSSAGVASVLRSGSYVDVYECLETSDKTYSVQQVLSSMYVYDVLNTKLQSLKDLDERLEEAVVEEDTDYDFLPAFVVFRCTEEQAQTLIRLERSESLHLTLQRMGGE